jgi:hypothetical protein
MAVYGNAALRWPDDILDNYLKFLYFFIQPPVCEDLILAKLFRVGKHMTDAIWTLMKYIGDTTGIEPSQEEIAKALKSYFILNEIENQIKFQRKKPNPQGRMETPLKRPFWALNLIASSPKSNFIRAGLFYKGMHDAIKATRDFVKKSSGDEPSDTEIASSIQCDFILSEIKNQINWQRQGASTTKEPESNPG